MMPGENFISIPEVTNTIKQYNNVEYVAALNMHEWETRNIYLERCHKGDVLLWIDTDEWLVITDNNFIDNILATTAPMFHVHYKHPGMSPNAVRTQGFRYPSETRHRDRHNQLWYKNKEVWTHPGPAPEGFELHTNKIYRSEKRIKAMQTRNKLRPFR